MKPRTLFLASPLVLALGLAACDSRDYEAEVATLSEELSATEAELESAVSENEQLQAELEELRAQADEAAADEEAGEQAEQAAAEGDGGTDPAVDEAIRGELQAMTEKLTVALTNLNEVDQQAEVELGDVRQSLQEVVDSAQTILTVVAGPEAEPAAGPEEGEAAPDAPAEATGDDAPPDVMEEEGEEPQQ